MKIRCGHFRIGCRTAMLIAIVASGQTAADPNDLLEQSRALRRQFIAEKSSAINTKTPHEEDASLTQLIEQIMALQIPTPMGPNTPTPSEPAAEMDARSAAETQHADDRKTATVKDSEDGVSPQTALELLETSDKAKTVPYPAELADILYRAGKPDEARRYYEMALSSVDHEDVALHQWLLFQTANCLRRVDPSQAVKRYEELIRLYPNSVWAAVSQARHGMLAWKETRHDELLKQTNQRSGDEQ